jgi:hypothetical protein
MEQSPAAVEVRKDVWAVEAADAGKLLGVSLDYSYDPGRRPLCVAWYAVNSTNRQALDMRKRHVD